MGLDTSHGAWHGAYSAFMRWRQMIAKIAGLPPLDLMVDEDYCRTIIYERFAFAERVRELLEESAKP